MGIFKEKKQMSENNFSEQNETEEFEAGKDTFFAETVNSPEIPVKKGMSKNIKALLISIIALVLAGSVLTILLLTQKDEESDVLDTESMAEALNDDAGAVLLNEETADNLKEIQIVNEDQFRVYQVSAKTDDTEAVYTIEGYEDIPLDTGYISTLVNNGSELSADRLVEENAEDLAKYGLSEPSAKVVMTYADGTKFEFSVGDVSPTETTEVYCAVGNNVYLVKNSLVSNYQKKTDFFFSKIMLEKPAEEDMPIVESLRINRKDLDYDLYMEYSYEQAEDDSVGGTAATHILYEPVFAYLNVEKSSDVISSMFGLTAEEIAEIHPTAESLAQAGMNDPFCTVTMKCDDGETHVLKFGNTYTTAESEKTAYYAMIDDTDILYGVADTRAVWTTVQAGDITSANIFGTYVWDIAELNVTAGGKELTFSGEGEDAKTYTVTKNGETCDVERFRNFYKFLLNIYGEELYLDMELPATTPDAEVHLTTQDGKEDYTISFYKTDSLNAMIAVNGTPTYKIRSSCIDTLIHNVEIFDGTEEFAMTWQ